MKRLLKVIGQIITTAYRSIKIAGLVLYFITDVI